MLGKLLKHEWNATMKVLLPANGVVILFTILGRIMLGLKIFEIDNEIIGAVGGLCLAVYILSLFAVSIACIIYIAIRFYKTVYTDEGYLLHTLPVTSTEITWSKMLIGTMWSLITCIVVIASVLVLVTGSVSAEDFRAIYREARINLLSTHFGSVFTGWMIFGIFFAILNCFYSTLWLFASISFGQLITKHKVLGAFIGYAIGYFMAQIVSIVVLLVSGTMNKALLMEENVGFDSIISYFNSVFGISFVITLIFTILYYLFTSYMMRRRLNLD